MINIFFHLLRQMALINSCTAEYSSKYKKSLIISGSFARIDKLLSFMTDATKIITGYICHYYCTRMYIELVLTLSESFVLHIRRIYEWLIATVATIFAENEIFNLYKISALFSLIHLLNSLVNTIIK